jgi:hypothetical protein
MMPARKARFERMHFHNLRLVADELKTGSGFATWLKREFATSFRRRF